MSARPKRALVTGGSSGLGASIVRWLDDRDYDVVVLDRVQPGFERLVVEFIACDLRERDSVNRALPTLIAAGPYDIVVLNAGINATGRFETIDAQDHLDVLRANAEAPAIIAARLLEADACLAGGAMAFISSLSHFTGYPGAAGYAASKDALAIYANSMRQYAKSKAVTITVAFPGPLRTRHAELHSPEGADASKRMEPDLAAGIIMTDVLAGKASSIPGLSIRLFALAGRILPGPVTAVMRRLIYARLKSAK